MNSESTLFETPPPLDQVNQYHQRTKHQFNRYARSLGYLDWANQPNPFRRFDGAPVVPLPLLSLDDEPASPPYDSLFAPGSVPSQPVTLRSLSRLFEYALSLTAWKASGGTRWALRSNPSSGNLHPTEGYALFGPLPHLALPAGLYHYAPQAHALEHRWAVNPEMAQHLFHHAPQNAFLVGLSSIHWREAWKYGERAFRYCQHDIGHAIGTFRIAAATLGWDCCLLAGRSDDLVGHLLGLSRQQDFAGVEPEYPELLAMVWPTATHDARFLHFTHALAHPGLLTAGEWKGKATRLSQDEPVAWDLIDLVTHATWKTDSSPMPDVGHGPEPVAPLRASHHHRTSTDNTPGNGQAPASPSAGQIIHQRRSATAFDGNMSLPADRFFLMLERILPQAGLPLLSRPMPWDALPWNPTVHLALFIHRIDGLPPGLYWFNRFPEQRSLSSFQSVMHEHFQWTKPEGCPADLSLYLLEAGNGQKLATQLSCGQDIAGDSAFSLGMIAEFDEPLLRYGPWFYKRLFWETGLIGQLLYLEAEAAGVRATGIGCFFDDPVHDILGFHPSTALQSLYHFTVGGPLDDGRLTTLPPYGSHST